MPSVVLGSILDNGAVYYPLLFGLGALARWVTGRLGPLSRPAAGRVSE